MFRHWYDHFRDFLDRHGLRFGVPAMGGSVALDLQSHGGNWVSVFGTVVAAIGIIGNLWIRHRNSNEYRRTCEAIRRAAESGNLPAAASVPSDPSTREPGEPGRSEALLRLFGLAKAPVPEAQRKPPV